MRPVLRRIAVHGALTAVVLAALGLMFAELGAMWLATSPGTRAATGGPVEQPDADGAIRGELRRRVPLFMALWGFGFVAVGETVLAALGRRKPPAPPAAPPPDDAEKLLLQLLREAEAKQAEGEGVDRPAVPPENSPTPDPPAGERGACVPLLAPDGNHVQAK